MGCNECVDCLSDYQEAMTFFGRLYKRNIALKKENDELREENLRLLQAIENWKFEGLISDDEER